MANPPTQNINVNLNEMESDVCDNCGCWSFQPLIIFKCIPALLAGQGAGGETMAQVSYFACSQCGKPHRSTPVELFRKKKPFIKPTAVLAEPPAEVKSELKKV